jgi:hypothetical protein
MAIALATFAAETIHRSLLTQNYHENGTRVANLTLVIECYESLNGNLFEGHHWTKYTIRLSRLELNLNNIFIWQEPRASGRIPQRFTPRI